MRFKLLKYLNYSQNFFQLTLTNYEKKKNYELVKVLIIKYVKYLIFWLLIENSFPEKFKGVRFF